MQRHAFVEVGLYLFRSEGVGLSEGAIDLVFSLRSRMLPAFEMRREDHFEVARTDEAEAGLLTDAS
jgi:hypothetical protein